MNKKFDDAPLSESSVSLGLAEIQKRCSQLIEDPNELSALSLEEPASAPDNGNPYNRG